MCFRLYLFTRIVSVFLCFLFVSLSYFNLTMYNSWELVLLVLFCFVMSYLVCIFCEDFESHTLHSSLSSVAWLLLCSICLSFFNFFFFSAPLSLYLFSRTPLCLSHSSLPLFPFPPSLSSLSLSLSLYLTLFYPLSISLYLYLSILLVRFYIHSACQPTSLFISLCRYLCFSVIQSFLLGLFDTKQVSTNFTARDKSQF